MRLRFYFSIEYVFFGPSSLPGSWRHFFLRFFALRLITTNIVSIKMYVMCSCVVYLCAVGRRQATAKVYITPNEQISVTEEENSKKWQTVKSSLARSGNEHKSLAYFVPFVPRFHEYNRGYPSTYICMACIICYSDNANASIILFISSFHIIH